MRVRTLCISRSLALSLARSLAHVLTRSLHLRSPALHRFLFTIPAVGQIIMFQTHLPLLENKGLAQQIRFSWFASEGVPAALASYVVGGTQPTKSQGSSLKSKSKVV